MHGHNEWRREVRLRSLSIIRELHRLGGGAERLRRNRVVTKEMVAWNMRVCVVAVLKGEAPAQL